MKKKANTPNFHQGMTVEIPNGRILSKKAAQFVVIMCNALSRAVCAGGNVTIAQNGGMIIKPGTTQSTPSSATSAGIKMFSIATVSQDSFTATPVGGGTAVSIAKHPFMRGIASEIIDGVVVNYSNYSADGNSRVANDGSGNVVQKPIQQYKVGQKVVACKPENGVDIVGFEWIELTPREWSGIE